MALTLKSDIINAAYSKLRISGKTSMPTPEDIDIAISRLEIMAHEMNLKSIGYNFEDEPDPSSKHGIVTRYVDRVSGILAGKLMVDFGKGMTPDPKLMNEISVAYSVIASATAITRQIQPPSIMPLGSGNRRCWVSDTYQEPELQAPISILSNYLTVGSVEDYEENFDTYLKDGEDISAYTIDADNGLTIVSDSLATPVISFRIQADYTTSLSTVKILVTTDSGRKTTRTINFEVVA
jgi:hypothetical protein